MRVKICGVCRPQDASAVEAAGADYIGVILAAKGPRAQDEKSAERIFGVVGRASKVGVFADQERATIARTCAHLALDVMQLHGSETPELVRTLRAETGRVVWKKVTLREADDLVRAVAAYGDVASGLLLDSGSGGSGVAFDWELARAARALLPPGVDLIVAGGLTPENVKHVAARLHPDVVDVASGVEIQIGEKSDALIEAFVRNARS
ncbi:MAG: phosphoribosylanthranilate isomerase [Gemmatimonadota bacterium]